jgi:hypothetical protein
MQIEYAESGSWPDETNEITWTEAVYQRKIKPDEQEETKRIIIK